MCKSKHKGAWMYAGVCRMRADCRSTQDFFRNAYDFSGVDRRAQDYARVGRGVRRITHE